MTSATDGPAGFRFSTRDLPGRERAGAVQGLHARGVLPVRLEPLPDRPVQADIAKWSLPGLSVLSRVLCGVRQEGPPGRSARGGGDDLCLRVNPADRRRGARGPRRAAAGDPGRIAANLHDGGLRVAAVAARQRVTPRYVHKLFEGEGATFAQFVLRQRLAARSALRESPQGKSFDRVSGRCVYRSISLHPTPGRASLSAGTRFQAAWGGGRGGRGGRGR